jgi:hypothetical protein
MSSMKIAGTLDVDKKDLGSRMCPECNMRFLCDKEGTVEKLTVYCLEGVFHR